MYCTSDYLSPVGHVTLASEGENLVGLWLEGQKYFGGTLPEKAFHPMETPVLHAAKDWLDRYFSGENPDPKELPLHPMGSAFRQAVWHILLEIPYGAVTTYGAIAQRMAEKLGKPGMSAQAVGGAVGHNPISIIIPCHRVVGADGSLTGYAGGIETKIALLRHEGVDLTDLYIPKRGTALSKSGGCEHPAGKEPAYGMG